MGKTLLCPVRRWKTCRLDKPYHIPWRAAHSKFIVKSWGCTEHEDGTLGSYPDQHGCTKWERMIDVDWSSNFGLYGYTGPKDGYWAEDRQQFYYENYRETSTSAFRGGISMWGSVSVHGLYPSDGPIFFDDLVKSPAYKVQSFQHPKGIAL